MSPEKKDEGAAKPPPLIRRVGINLKIGILGLPNVGRTTFFNVLTKSAAPAKDFPFCTIDPKESRAPVPDKRWEFLCDFYQPPSKVPAYLSVVDIAALVKGAHEGKGLGNAFLSYINTCDAIFHVVRAFSDEKIVHVEGDVDPARDLQIIYDELRLKDLEYLKKHIEPLERSVTQEGEDKKKEEYDVLKKVEGLLEDNKWVRVGQWDAKEVEVLKQHLFLTTKPVIYLVNLSEKDYIHNKNEWLVKIKEWVDGNDPGALVIPISCGLELKLTQMASGEERENYLKEVGTTSALEKIILDSHKALNLVHYFTSGKEEVRAWMIPVGTKAPAAAGRIHTDFEKGFIMAEVMNFQDFKEAGSEAACKAAGKHQQRESDYIVEDGDIIFFKFNLGQG